MRPSPSLASPKRYPTLLTTRRTSDLRQLVPTTAKIGKIHRHTPQDLPAPAPFLYPQTVVLADGSSFTTMTTSPRSVLKMTRDLSNHPTWFPNRQTSRDLRDEFGRIGKFKEMYSSAAKRGRVVPGGAARRKVEEDEEGDEDEEDDAFTGGLEDWMSEGAVEMEEKVKKVYAKPTGGKGGRRK